MDRAAIVTQLEDEIRELTRVKNILTGSPIQKRRTGTGHKMSAAARHRISIAQKARWSKQKKAA